MADVILSMTEFATALKIVYGELLPNQINTEVGPLQSRIVKSTKNVVGGERVDKLAPYGLSGNVGAFSETGSLPVASKQNVVRFTSYLKNQGGRAMFTEKVLKASRSDRAAFVSASDQAMKAMKESATFDYGRQFYLDGTGILTLCGVTTASATLVVASTQYLIEGMVIDIYNVSNALITNGTNRKISGILSDTTVLLEGTDVVTTGVDGYVTNQGALNNELSGIKLVMAQSGSLYGLARATYPWLNAKVWPTVGALDDTKIVKAIVDRGVKGSKIDLLVCHPDVWVTYGDFLSSSKQLSPTMELPGGWTALSVSGTPLVMDRFSKKQSIFGFETKQWTEHMLHDWEFQDDGMFQRVHGTANFEVLMTKYSELICDKPSSSFEMPLITVV